MPLFKKRPISTANAQKLRRGIITGQIYLDHIEKMALHMPPLALQGFAGRKLFNYRAGIHSPVEEAAFTETVYRGLIKIIPMEQADEIFLLAHAMQIGMI